MRDVMKKRYLIALTIVWVGLVVVSGYFNMNSSIYPALWFVPAGVWAVTSAAMVFAVLVVAGYIKVYRLEGYDVLVPLCIALLALPFMLPVALEFSVGITITLFAFFGVFVLSIVYLFVKRGVKNKRKWVMIACLILSVLIPFFMITPL